MKKSVEKRINEIIQVKQDMTQYLSKGGGYHTLEFAAKLRFLLYYIERLTAILKERK